MKKRIFPVIALLLAVSIFLGGCGVLGSVLANVLFARTVGYDDMQYTRPDMTNIEQVLQESCALALEETDIDTVVDGIWNFYNVYDDFYTNLNLAFIGYCRDLSDLYWQDEYAYCSEQSATVDAGLDSLYRALAKSPIRDTLETDEYFGAGYFESYEGESIYDEFLLLLMEQEAQVELRYQQINGDAADSEYYSETYFSTYGAQMAQVYVELIGVRQQIADYLGYDSYVQFAYDYYYTRDYTPEQALAYTADIRAELSPMYVQMCKGAYGDVTIDYCTSSQMLSYLESATKSMGGTVYQAFRAMKKGKLYDITYSEKKYASSFEVYLNTYNSPYVFLCPTGGEYDKLTFAHEFGHFCCDYATYGGANQGIDVAEIFSQSMEYLSLCYSNGVDELKKWKMLDCLSVYVEQAAYAAFEHQVYSLTGDELTVENVQALYADVIESFGMNTDGWDSRDYVCITHFYQSPLYVISYVLSNDAALQIYELETEQTGQGLDCYVQNMTSTQPYIMAFLEEAGLESPFADGRLTKVKQTLQKAWQ